MTAIYRPPSNSITSVADPTGGTDAFPQVARELARLRPGGMLRLNPGYYRLDSQLVVPPGVAVVGSNRWAIDAGNLQAGIADPKSYGTTLGLNWNPTATGPTDPPLVLLNSNSTLEGLAVVDPRQGVPGSTLVARPFAVGTAYGASPTYIGSSGVTIRRVGVFNVQRGITMPGALRFVIEGVCLSASDAGIDVDQCWDTSHLDRAHVIPGWNTDAGGGTTAAVTAYLKSNLVAYRFGHVDGFQFTNSMVYLCKTGVLLNPSALATNPRKPWLVAANVCLDVCGIVVDLQAGQDQGCQFTGGSLTSVDPGGCCVRTGATATDYTAGVVNASFANVSMGCENGPAVLHQGGDLTLAGCTFNSVGNMTAGSTPSILVTGGNLSLVGGSFADARPPVSWQQAGGKWADGAYISRAASIDPNSRRNAQ